MALLDVQSSNFKGLTINYNTADASGDSFVNNGQTKLFVKNGATDLKLTIKTQKDSLVVDGYGNIDLTDEVLTIAENTEQIIGFFPVARFNTVEGFVEIEYDDASNVEIGVITYE